ncbi:ABC transporter ATP-binding protein [Fusobacterium varium]
MIRLEKLSYRYKDNKFKTIEEVNISIKKGEFVVITGRSGSGKSTLFRCINGLCPLFFDGEKSGNIYLNDKNIAPFRICDISKMVSSVFQNPENQFFTADVLSDLVYACENYGISKQEIEQRMKYIVSLLSLNNIIEKKLSDLSGGEKQKIAIASILMLNTNILLLDEPSSNLDYQSIILLSEILEKLKAGGYTIIVIEHRLFYMKKLCDKLIVMEHGKISGVYGKSELKTMNNDMLHEKGLRGINLFQSVVRDPPKDRFNEPLLELKDITFGYKKEREILKGVSFSVFPGDKVALLGKNGCGDNAIMMIVQ